MPRVLFVCSDNRARSPLAAAYFARAGRSAGLEDLEVESAGIWARPEEMIDPGAVAALEKEGLLPLRRGCRPLLPKLVRSSDLIVCMTREMADQVERRFVSARDKTVTLMGLVQSDTGVFDPRGEPGRCSQCLGMMKPALDRLAERLA